RMHFADACASLWIDGELVHIEDLVLHDGAHDVRAPTHELTIAFDVLSTRRRIGAQPANWAFSPPGLNSLCRGGAAEEVAHRAEGEETTRAVTAASSTTMETVAEEPDEDASDPLIGELAAIDALLARSDAAIAAARVRGQ